MNGFYFYTISHIDDPGFNLDIIESYVDDNPNDPINQYFTLCVGWNAFESTKSDILPIDV